MNDHSHTLGRRPPPLLNRLGEVLRPHYQTLLEAPLPPRLQALCDELDRQIRAADQQPNR